MTQSTHTATLNLDGFEILTHALRVASRLSFSNYRRKHCDKIPALDGPELVAMNELLPVTKLEWSLDMAEAVALLHNHERGVIVHDDIQLSQFLISEDGHLKMGDFNRAEVSMPLSEYCTWALFMAHHKRFCA